jgi:hypothetical protein
VEIAEGVADEGLTFKEEFAEFNASLAEARGFLGESDMKTNL